MSSASSKSERGRRRARGSGNGWDDQGGYMQAKIRKLERQFTIDRPGEIQKQKSSTSIFKGIAIFVNGYTIPSSDELKKLMLQHGGVFHHYYARSKVTHIIASNLPNSKIDKITDKKIVKPEWITDSVKAEKCLPYENYLLYTARSTVQPGLHRYASNASTTSLLSETSEPESPKESLEKDTPVKNNVQSPDQGPHLNSTVSLSNNSLEKSHSKLKSPPESNSRYQAKPGDPGFVAEFYNHSRLHYLSTWGAEFRVYVNELHAKGGNSYPGRDRLKHLVETNSLESYSQGSIQDKHIKTRVGKTIMHIDMDCFFVSVGLRNRPELVGKPVVVTHSRGKGVVKERPGADPEYERQHYRKRAIERSARKAGIDLERNPDMSKVLEGQGLGDEEPEDEEDSDASHQKETSNKPTTTKETFLSMSEIASASYEARKAGIKNGMFMGPAKVLCPDLVTIPYDFDGYREVSQKLYDTVASYTHDIEAVSCDEMLVDLTDVLNESGASAAQLATTLRKEIFEKTQCRASVGMGPSILAAKLATKKAKPNGQFYVDHADMNTFILDKAVRDLPGVGWSTSNKLQNMSVTTCQDLQRIPLETLQKEFGPKTGQSLYRACRGQDDRAIKIEKERKSVSAEINYGIRFSQESEVDSFIAQVAQEVHDRMERIKVKGKTITLKLKVRAKHAPVETAKFLGHGICDNVTKSVSLPIATDSSSAIHKECMGIIKSLKIPPTEFRGVGIQMSKLESSEVNVALTSKGLQSILNFASKVDKVKEIPEQIRANSASNHDNKETSEKENDPLMNIEKERLRHPSLPPLPTLPDLNSSDSSLDTPKTPKAAVREVQGSVPKEELYLPSPSQVDMDVLNELPADIRQQIEQDMKLGNKKRESNKKNYTAPRSVDNYDDRADNDGARPGCSNWTPHQETNDTDSFDIVPEIHGNNSGDDPPPMTKPTDKSMSSQNGLSYSQIDQSVLAALPPEIQREIEVQYQKGTVSNGHTKVMQARLNNKSPSKSPKKSPKGKTGGPGSPKFKVPRGRPPGKKNKVLNPKKLDFEKQSEVDTQTQADDVPLENEIGSSENHTESDVEPPNLVDCEESSNMYTYVPKTISLCGAVTLSEVKHLLQEWIISTDEPENDDIARFVQYLFDLVEDKDLEMVYLILKALKRKVNQHAQTNTTEWMKTYDLVIFRTQSIVLSQYNATLKL